MLVESLFLTTFRGGNNTSRSSPTSLKARASSAATLVIAFSIVPRAFVTFSISVITSSLQSSLQVESYLVDDTVSSVCSFAFAACLFCTSFCFNGLDFFIGTVPSSLTSGGSFLLLFVDTGMLRAFTSSSSSSKSVSYNKSSLQSSSVLLPSRLKPVSSLLSPSSGVWNMSIPIDIINVNLLLISMPASFLRAAFVPNESSGNLLALNTGTPIMCNPQSTEACVTFPK